MQANIIRNDIAELNLNEIETVAGGASYPMPQTATYSTLPSASLGTATGYVAPSYSRPTVVSTSLLSASIVAAPKPI